MHRTTLALILTVTSVAAAYAHGQKIDWAAIKPFESADMKWLVVDQTNDKRAMYGIPDSDGALLWFDCIAKGSVELTYVDSELKPSANYHLHMKAGERTVDIKGKAGKRLKLDDLVFLKTVVIKDKPFLANLKKGDQLTVVIDREKKGRFNAFSLPGHGATLDRFFKACAI